MEHEKLIDTLLTAAETCEQAATVFDEDPVSSLTSTLVEATNALDQASAGSWTGYHSTIYTQGLRPRQPGEHFDSEWGAAGVFATQTTGEWAEYPYETIRDEILRRADNPDLEIISKASEGAQAAFGRCKRELLPVLDAFLSKTKDDVVQELRTQLHELKNRIAASNYIDALGPSQTVTRDSVAAQGGVQPPHHVRFQAWLIEQLSVKEQLRKLAELARHLARYLQEQPIPERQERTMSPNDPHDIEKKALRLDIIKEIVKVNAFIWTAIFLTAFGGAFLLLKQTASASARDGAREKALEYLSSDEGLELFAAELAGKLTHDTIFPDGLHLVDFNGNELLFIDTETGFISARGFIVTSRNGEHRIRLGELLDASYGVRYGLIAESVRLVDANSAIDSGDYRIRLESRPSSLPSDSDEPIFSESQIVLRHSSNAPPTYNQEQLVLRLTGGMDQGERIHLLESDQTGESVNAWPE